MDSKLATSSSEFNPAYWLSKPTELRVFDVNVTPDEESRVLRAQELLFKGFQIDVPIDIWGFDPFKTMLLRQQFGYTWVPAAGQPNLSQMGVAAPGLSSPGLGVYDPAHPPGGAIKVSIDLADYPPFDPPVVAKPPAPADVLVGPYSGWANFYEPVAGDRSPDGKRYEDARGKFIKHAYFTAFGFESQWEKVTAWPTA